MARGFNFGYYADVPCGGIPKQLDIVGATVKSTSCFIGHVGPRTIRWHKPGTIIKRMATPGANLGELREPRYFQPPSFIFAEMKMHHVDLIERQQIEYFHDLLLGLEITRYVQHYRTVRKTRLVGDSNPSNGNCIRLFGPCIWWKKPFERLNTVKCARGGRRFDQDATGVDGEPITFSMDAFPLANHNRGTR